MVVTHEMVIDATGPEGTVRVAVGFSTDPGDVRPGGLQSKVIEAYRCVFETEDEPEVRVQIRPPAAALAS